MSLVYSKFINSIVSMNCFHLMILIAWTNSQFGQSCWCVSNRTETKKWRQKNKKRFSLYVMQHHRLVPKYNLSAFPCLLSIQITFTSNFNDRSINYFPNSTKIEHTNYACLIISHSFWNRYRNSYQYSISRKAKFVHCSTHSLRFCVYVHMQYLLRVFFTSLALPSGSFSRLIGWLLLVTVAIFVLTVAVQWYLSTVQMFAFRIIIIKKNS